MNESPVTLDFCLLVPYFNNPAGLLRSLESICCQRNSCVVLIVNDGSTEMPDMKMVESCSGRGGYRVEWINLEINKGIIYALNAGLEWIYEKKIFTYVARLDCGDLCKPERFTEQLQLLQKFPELILTGSWCEFRDHKKNYGFLYRTPEKDRQIRRGMYFRNLFIHPTVMWKINELTNRLYYPYGFPHAEDYAFFFELLKRGEGRIIPEVLVVCEINPQGISITRRKEQINSRAKAIRYYGNSTLLKLAGRIKLKVLSLLPVPFVWKMKRVIWGTGK